MREALEEVARVHDAAANELEQAVRHCRTAAIHFRDGEVPSGAAHAWAAFGHIWEAEESLHAQARTHARKAVPEPADESDA